MCIWAARLCLVIVERVLKFGKNAKFHRAKHDPAKFLIFRSRQGLWVFVTLLHTFALHSSTLTLAFGLKNFNGFGIWVVDCACLLREGFNKKNDGYQTPSPGTSTHWTDFLSSLSIQVSPPSSSERTTSRTDIVL